MPDDRRILNVRSGSYVQGPIRRIYEGPVHPGPLSYIDIVLSSDRWIRRQGS
jgi:hypothetical protein